jgi:hypothetical protein
VNEILEILKEIKALLIQINENEERRGSFKNTIWFRCPYCNGTGKNEYCEDGYCNCKTGRDLKTIERGKYPA